MTAAGERGTTRIGDRAVRAIAARAATEALPGEQVEVTGARAAVRGGHAEVALRVTAPYPVSLDEAGADVHGHVTARTRELTGLTVNADVGLSGLRPRRAASLTKGADVDAPRRQPARGPWSERRLPAAVVALAGAAVSALGCADLVVRAVAPHHGAGWHARVVTWLSSPGDGLVVAAGSAGVVLGAVLLWAALAPGRRRGLPLAPPAPGTGAVLTRRAVAAVVGGAVARVSGIGAVRVAVGRRRLVVRARLAFGDPVASRDEVESVARDAVAACGLARPRRLRVRVRPTAAWRRPETDPTATEQPEVAYRAAHP
ncbi:DUF6286 domain-containing protein [Streptomyces noursei]|uniref:DUF6286 domain-containing protein n=1 Tax=Streptomyces noursei TaxID=1971 RepID=UPI0005C970AE|nr:DUF6286 domain-containing protein [Streptomyces noursei]